MYYLYITCVFNNTNPQCLADELQNIISNLKCTLMGFLIHGVTETKQTVVRVEVFGQKEFSTAVFLCSSSR